MIAAVIFSISFFCVVSSQSTTTCLDQPACATTPDICTSGDQDTVNALCPYTCGGCVCEDNPATGGSCSTLVPGICSDDLAVTLCPKSCGLCGPAGGSPATTVTTPLASDGECKDEVIGITCAQLPYPCNDDLGKLACKKFCNLCPEDTTTPQPITTAATTRPTTVQTTAPTTATTAAPTAAATVAQTTKQTAAAPTGPCANQPCLNGGSCVPDGAGSFSCVCPDTHYGAVCHISGTPPPPPTTRQPVAPGACGTYQTTRQTLGCEPAEIVFMIEYSVSDLSWFSVDHEGDYVKAMLDEWRLDDNHVRVGLVVYHDTVREVIHLGDYSSRRNLKDKISRITRELRPSGDADLGKALDFVRENAFKGARSGVERIVVPIVHQMDSPEKPKILPAADRLKAECVAILGMAVEHTTLDYDLVKQMVTQPSDDYVRKYNSYYSLEEAGKDYKPNCDN